MSDVSDIVIDVNHVAKRFGDVHALRDVSLRVARGSIHGFLGPNGAGKTTTMRGLIGMTRFDSGFAQVLGMHPWRDRVAIHARLGYLPSSTGMYRGMRGTDVLDYAASLASGQGAASPLRARVLDAVELSKRDLARPVHDYSKGMRQKIAICQALQHDPDLLMMDEPNEGLDPLVQHSMYELLLERAAAGRTILFSSHALSEVEALCERVTIIRQGALVVSGTLDELREHRPRTVRIAASASELARLGSGFERRADDHAGRAVFDVRLEPDEVLRRLAGVHVSDVVIEEASLDEIFRAYYAGDPPTTGDDT